MRELLKIQEGMDLCLNQRDEELHQLHSQFQSDGAQLAVLSLQVQELISSVESRAKVVGKDLEEINGWFNHHRGEINCIKIREKDAKEETEKLKGFVIGAGHEAQVFKDCLDRMEENVCRCGRTPSEVGEEFISSEDKSRTELSHASVGEDTYVAPLSRIQLLTSKISHICQEIHGIKESRKPESNLANQNSTSAGLDEGQTNQNYTWELDSSNSAKEGSDCEDGLGETYSSHSKLHHREPSNPDNPSHHAPIPPSPNPPPSESIQEPPGDLSPSPTSRIVTLIPSSLL